MREIRELDEPFSNCLMFPGDPSGSAAEVINCRCAALQRAKWALNAEETKYLGKAENMTDEQLEPLARKLNIDVDELRKYSGQIIPIRAKNYDDFRRQYEKIWNYEPVKRNTVVNSSGSSTIKISKGQLKSYTKIAVDDIPSMDESKYNKVKDNLIKQGIQVIQDADGDAYLKAMGAEAMTLSDGSAVIFQSGRVPSASAVFEEIIHTTQIKRNGMITSTGDTSSAVEYINREIEANEKLIKYQKAYSLTDKDVESIQENLKRYYEELKGYRNV